MLPDDLDPRQSPDPDLVLDMALSTDPSARAGDLRAMEAEAWETPVVLFGMRGDSATKLAHELLHGEDYFGKNGAGVATVYIDRRCTSGSTSSRPPFPHPSQGFLTDQAHLDHPSSRYARPY